MWSAFLSGALPVAAWTALPMLLFLVQTVPVANNPVEPFFVLGAMWLGGSMAGGACCTVPVIWSSVMHRWFSSR
jgi:hypothetical protein